MVFKSPRLIVPIGANMPDFGPGPKSDLPGCQERRWLLRLTWQVVRCYLNIPPLSTTEPLAVYRLSPLSVSHCYQVADNLAQRCRFWLKAGQIGPKWDKSGTFPIGFLYILFLNLIWKSPGYLPIGTNLTHFLGQKLTSLSTTRFFKDQLVSRIPLTRR